MHEIAFDTVDKMSRYFPDISIATRCLTGKANTFRVSSTAPITFDEDGKLPLWANHYVGGTAIHKKADVSASAKKFGI